RHGQSNSLGEQRGRGVSRSAADAIQPGGAARGGSRGLDEFLDAPGFDSAWNDIPGVATFGLEAIENGVRRRGREPLRACGAARAAAWPGWSGIRAVAELRIAAHHGDQYRRTDCQAGLYVSDRMVGRVDNRGALPCR